MVERSAWLDEFLVIDVPIEPPLDVVFEIGLEFGSRLARCPIGGCGMLSDLGRCDHVMISWGEVVERAGYICRFCGTEWVEER